jgi:nitrite reductase/ring-hydroxylating ferredoxin subunit
MNQSADGAGDANMSQPNPQKRIPLPIPFGWYSLGPSVDLGKGEARAVRFFGQNLALYRGEDGEPRMIEAYCRHLGAHLGKGKVNGDTIECPFHAWRYDGKGVCVDIPYAERIPALLTRPCLKVWPVVDRNGLLMAWHHPNQAPPSWQPEVFAEASSNDWSDFEVFEWRIATHPQEMAENAADPAHFKYVHGTPTLPDWDVSYNDHKRSGEMRGQTDASAGETPLIIKNGNIGPGEAWTRFSGLCDLFLMAHVTPIEQDEVCVRFSFSYPKPASPGLPKAFIKEVVRQLEQDIEIWEHKVFLENPILCDGDGPIGDMRRYFEQFYAKADG